MYIYRNDELEHYEIEYMNMEFMKLYEYVNMKLYNLHTIMNTCIWIHTCTYNVYKFMN